MKRFIAFVRKEFYHIVRDRRTAAILFGMPILQLLLFGYAIRNEISEVRTGILDYSHDVVTEALTDKLFSSGTFRYAGSLASEKEIPAAFASGKMNEVVVFEPGFAGRLQKDGVAHMQIVTDGSDPNVSRTVTGYTESVVRDYLSEQADGSAQFTGVEVVPVMMFNPSLKSVYLFVPGLMAMLLMLVSALMTSISITREKESGTMELLLVSSLRPAQIIVGKVVPFWIVGLVIARLGFHVPMLGSYGVIYFVAAIYLLVVLGMGLLISTVTESQQQAMFIAWFFMVIFTLLSGLFTPIESMPHWAQNLTLFNPVRHFVDIMRRVMLKGAGIGDITTPLFMLAVQAIILLSFAVNRYRKVSV